MFVTDWPHFLKEGFKQGEKLSSVTIGVFDGVHRGHRELLKRIIAHNANYVPVIITFRENRKKEKAADSITTFKQKLEIFEELGVKVTLAVDFTDSFRRMAGKEFLETLAKRGNPGFLAIGSSFRCGYGLDTGAAEIAAFFAARGIPVETVDEVLEGGLPISSSRIRAAIREGNPELAERMLGRPIKPI